MLFVLTYDRRVGQIRDKAVFEDQQRNQARQKKLELELAAHADGDVAVEIVLLEAADEEALKRTHGRYFKSIHAI